MIVLFATRTSTRTSVQFSFFFLGYLRIHFIICEKMFLFNNKIYIIKIYIFADICFVFSGKFPSLAMKTKIDC